MISFLKRFATATTILRRPLAAFNSGGDVLVNSRTVRAMLGNISHMTLHRWQHGLNDRKRDRIIKPLVGFPAPIPINGRRYWRRSDLEKFIAERAQEAA